MSVTGTLSLEPTDGAISTDENGQHYDSFGDFGLFLSYGLYVNQATPAPAFCFFGPSGSVCPPSVVFTNNSVWTAPAVNPVANLTVEPGMSVDLELGTITLGPDLPAGTYTTDIGVYNQCTAFCFFFPFALPTYADAGPLTIVISAPEPASGVLLLSGMAMRAGRRYRRSGK